MDVIDQENTLIFKKLTPKVGREASMYNYMYLCQMKKAILYSYKTLYTGSCPLQHCEVKVYYWTVYDI